MTVNSITRKKQQQRVFAKSRPHRSNFYLVANIPWILLPSIFICYASPPSASSMPVFGKHCVNLPCIFSHHLFIITSHFHSHPPLHPLRALAGALAVCGGGALAEPLLERVMQQLLTTLGDRAANASQVPAPLQIFPCRFFPCRFSRADFSVQFFCVDSQIFLFQIPFLLSAVPRFLDFVVAIKPPKG